MLILGLDPGSRVTGFGVLQIIGTRMQYIAAGSIKTDKKRDYMQRLPDIAEGIEEVLRHYQPEVSCIERVFVAKNPSVALKLGQVRGIALGLLIQHHIPIYEYAAREAKKMITGQGNANKQQVQYMVQRLLGLDAPPSEDAADALALAICHIRNSNTVTSSNLTNRTSGKKQCE